jgi:hypothetical protein
VVAVTPPPAPVLTQPAAGLITNTNVLTIAGTAEPGISLQLTRNGQVLAVTKADSNGQFILPNAPLAEGDNSLLAIASDSTGTTPSAVRMVTVETIPPAQPVMNPPVYTPGSGLTLSWYPATEGKASGSYQLFWGPSPFATTNQATGHSLVLASLSYHLQGLANGTYYFGVVGFDTAGNASPISALVSTVYDATPPALAVAYVPVPPLGVAPVTIVLTSSKALAGTPSLTLQPQGAYSPTLLSLTNVALNTWQTAYNVAPTVPTGPVSVHATAQDPAGNLFNGAPTGPQLFFDTTPPAGVLTTIPAGPIPELLT